MDVICKPNSSQEDLHRRVPMSPEVGAVDVLSGVPQRLKRSLAYSGFDKKLRLQANDKGLTKQTNYLLRSSTSGKAIDSASLSRHFVRAVPGDDEAHAARCLGSQTKSSVQILISRWCTSWSAISSVPVKYRPFGRSAEPLVRETCSTHKRQTSGLAEAVPIPRRSMKTHGAKQTQ